MGKKINFQVCDDISMFQVFKEYVRVNEDNEFFVDGNFVTGIEESGVMVDFQNFNHAYEIFNLLGSRWGGWEQTPTAQSMYCIAKKWEEAYKAEIIDISKDSIEFHLDKELSDKEIDELFEEIRGLHAESNYDGGFEKLREIIKQEARFSIWWD